MKKMMKKVITTVASTAVLLPPAACGNSDTDSAAATTAVAAIIADDSKASEGEDSVDADGADHTQGEPLKIRFATNALTGDVAGDGINQTGKEMIYFCKQTEERSGSRITTRMFTDDQLASPAQEYIGDTQDDAYEIFMLNCGSRADYTPTCVDLDIPYLYVDYDDAYAVLGSGLRQEWDQRAQVDIQCIPFVRLDMELRQLMANKEIHSPTDLRGAGVHTMVGPIQTNCQETFGVSVTPVPYMELYIALQQKLADAQENLPSNTVSSKIYEMQSYCMRTNHNFTIAIMAVSLILWSTLPEEDKVFIQDLWRETEIYVRFLTGDLSDGFFDEMQSKGVTVIELTTDGLKVSQDVAKSIWPQVEEQMGSEAYSKLVGFVPDYQAGK